MCFWSLSRKYLYEQKFFFSKWIYVVNNERDEWVKIIALFVVAWKIHPADIFLVVA